MYSVVYKRRVEKQILKIPVKVKNVLYQLINDLEEKGPIQSEWPNFSKLSDGTYHCHLTHKWVACWKFFENDLVIEVYYAGTREKAPY